MKSWDQLTEKGRLRRLRSVVESAIRLYDVDVQRVSLIGGFVNALYRLDTPTGPLAMRVDLLAEHTDENMLVELSWLEALDGVVDAPSPIRSRDGDLFVRVSAPGVPSERRCVLFTWVPGVPLADRITPELAETYGEMSARLHLHGAAHESQLRPMAWDRVFYFPDEIDPVVYDHPVNAGRFPSGGIDIVERAIEVIGPELASVTDRQIVHGDLHPWNVHVRRGRLWALDFADVMWGSRAQDIAITFYYLQGRPDTDELTSAFRRGYEQVAGWPTDDRELDLFMNARRLMFVNFVFNVGLDDLDVFLEGAVGKLEAFLGRRL